MDNYEILRESKVCYEYIRDILENSEFDFESDDVKGLSKTMDILGKIYEKTYQDMKQDLNELEQIKTDLDCPHCQNNVLISDLIDYAYLCEECDENMYLGEGDLNKEWYFDKKDKDIPLNKSFTLNVDYDIKEKNVFISSRDDGSGSEYNCNNLSEISDAVKNYINNYEISYYYITIWGTEEERDMGYAFNYLESYTDYHKAIEEAKKIMSREEYAYLEVIRDRDNKVIYGTDGIEEELYLKESESSYEL